MTNWEPPQTDGTTEVPVVPTGSQTAWWKRRRGRVPVWGWVAGGVIAIGGASALTAPDDEGSIATSVTSAPGTTVPIAPLADVSVASQPTAVTVTESVATTQPSTAPTTEITTAAATAAPTTLATIPPPTTTIAEPAATTTAAPTTSTTSPPAATTTEPPPLAAPSIGITTRFNADGNDNENKNDEWVRFTNEGSAPIDLSGWTVEDEGPKHRYSFGSLVLDAGASVTLFTGCGDNTDAERYWCNSGSAIWNNGGDVVSLFDSGGELIAQRSG